jgi:DNA-binding NtrC family response regulator
MELACVMTNSQTVEEDHITFNSTNAKSDFLLEEDSLEGYVRKIIKFYLQKYNNNVMVVAKKLDIGKSTIYRMLKNNEL